jgi:hypothetical protein
MRSKKAAQKLIVVSRNIDHTRTFPAFAQYLLNHIIMELRPVPRPLQPPAIGDIAHQVDRLCVIVLQKVQQQVSLTAPGTQVNV